LGFEPFKLFNLGVGSNSNHAPNSA
jgi:hypothetical protein